MNFGKFKSSTFTKREKKCSLALLFTCFHISLLINGVNLLINSFLESEIEERVAHKPREINLDSCTLASGSHKAAAAYLRMACCCTFSFYDIALGDQLACRRLLSIK